MARGVNKVTLIGNLGMTLKYDMEQAVMLLLMLVLQQQSHGVIKIVGSNKKRLNGIVLYSLEN